MAKTATKYVGSSSSGGAARNYLGVVASQAAMLALGAIKGDWCQRSDQNSQVYELTTAGASTLANWTSYPRTAVVDDTTTGGATAALSAEQGKSLKATVDTNTTNIATNTTAIAAAVPLTKLAAQAPGTVVMNASGSSASPAANGYSTLATALLPFLGSSYVSDLSSAMPAVWGPRGFADNQFAGVGISVPGVVDSSVFDLTLTNTDGSFGNWMRARIKAAAAAANRAAGASLSPGSVKLRLDATGSPNGRFPWKQPFAIAHTDAASTLFVGIISSVGSYTVQPSALTNDQFAVVCDSTDTTLHVQWRDNAASMTRVDLGANFPKTAHIPYVVVFSRDASGVPSVSILNRSNGAISTVTPSTGTLPRTSVDYGFMCYTGSGTAAATAMIDLGVGSLSMVQNPVVTDTEAVQDIVGALVANAGGTYNDAAGTITLPGNSTDVEAVQDIFGAMIVTAGGTYNDSNGTITLPSGGTITISNVTGLQTALDAKEDAEGADVSLTATDFSSGNLTLTKTAHANRRLIINVATDVTLTVQTDALGGTGAKDYFRAYQKGVGKVQFIGDGSTGKSTVRKSASLPTQSEQYGQISIERVGADEFARVA